MCDGHSADSDPCFTTLSVDTIELDLDVDNDLDLDLEFDELSGQESGSFSMLMDELNMEIDHSAVFGVTDMQGIVSHNLKALMFNVLTESYQNLHLSEHLMPTGLPPIREAETVDQDKGQNSLISSHHALHHSEVDTMRMQPAELKQHFIRAEEEKASVYIELQNNETMVQSLLSSSVTSSQHCIQSLRDHLHQSEDTIESLKLELKEKQEKIYLLNEKLFNGHKSTTLMQTDLDGYKDLCYRLQQQLSATEEQNRSLQEALMACKARVQEAEQEKQQEVESKEECRSKISNMFNILKGLNNWLELAMSDLQGQLKLALEREKSLRRTVEEATAKHKAEVQKLQHGLNKSKKKARKINL
ncbi:hypothetical protein Baya_10715 [Bagarius yarrelli]|uniref:Uncharacterized protein n=1 Tax=Bagarius yarrelli TaxID=175774 RepID=A0A556UG95_BAGYA|nr:hypothetical protein Baya_10715 [Bagarius yarrelli]